MELPGFLCKKKAQSVVEIEILGVVAEAPLPSVSPFHAAGNMTTHGPGLVDAESWSFGISMFVD
jgi:hypothetical protein